MRKCQDEIIIFKSKHINIDISWTKTEKTQIKNISNNKDLNYEKTLIAPLTGVVTSILVKKGDIVVKGDLIAQFEIMKMILDIYAKKNGKINRILITEGVLVSQGSTIFEIEPNV